MCGKIRFRAVMIIVSTLHIGCSAPAKFIYQYPETHLPRSAGFVLALANIDDQRTDRDVDRIYEQEPLIEVNNILSREIQSTGLFQQVVSISPDNVDNHEYLLNQHIDMVAKPTLTAMKLLPPGMGDILEKGHTLSAGLGGIFVGLPCGCLFGSIAADYRGYVGLKLRLVNLHSDTPFMDKEYSGVARRKASEARCSTRIKASLVGESLRIAMTELKTDLKREINRIQAQSMDGAHISEDQRKD